MPLPKRKLVPTILLALVLAALAAPPIWWSIGNPPVIDGTAAENNQGPANIGQAKHMAKSALEALRPILPATASQIEADLAPILNLTIPDPKPADWAEKQKAPSSSASSKPFPLPFTPASTPPPPRGWKPNASQTRPTTRIPFSPEPLKPLMTKTKPSPTSANSKPSSRYGLKPSSHLIAIPMVMISPMSGNSPISATCIRMLKEIWTKTT